MERNQNRIELADTEKTPEVAAALQTSGEQQFYRGNGDDGNPDHPVLHIEYFDTDASSYKHRLHLPLKAPGSFRVVAGAVLQIEGADGQTNHIPLANVSRYYCGARPEGALEGLGARMAGVDFYLARGLAAVVCNVVRIHFGSAADACEISLQSLQEREAAGEITATELILEAMELHLKLALAQGKTAAN
ncbi:MAG TPA: hypothetical protein VKY85_07830 [Candidatus Angelobacter sp.]|nr:hypothetical protein [Candidatus Angelobacter sp.]